MITTRTKSNTFSSPAVIEQSFYGKAPRDWKESLDNQQMIYSTPIDPFGIPSETPEERDARVEIFLKAARLALNIDASENVEF